MVHPKTFQCISGLAILDFDAARHLTTYPFFLTMGSADSTVCQDDFSTIQRFCQEPRIPLALDKLEGPSYSLTFLGIELDTVRIEARLPENKLTQIRTPLSSWLTRKKTTKRDILSLVGLL